jgi:predicted Fe-Mo cluster-binding NifX family protein
MSICIMADNAYTDGKMSEFFGRCKYFMFIDPETGELDIAPNTAACLNNAGTRTAADVAKHKPSAVITSRIGKNALKALRKAGIEVFTVKNKTVREALELYRSGKLEKLINK